MMNALPLPLGPAEIPGRSLRPERTPPKSDRFGKTEDSGSFASTLKAVHDDSRAKNEAPQARTDETHADHEVKETKDKEPRNKESDTSSGEASEQAVPPSDTLEKNSEVAENPAAPVSDMKATTQAESEPATEDGHQGRAGVVPRSGAQIKNPTQDNKHTDGKAPKEANAQDIAPESKMVGKEAPETDSKMVGGPSRGARAAGIYGHTAQTVAAARSDTPKPGDQPVEDEVEGSKNQAAQKTSGAATGGKALGTEAPPFTGDGDARDDNMSEMGRFAKQLQNRAVANSGEEARAADRQSASSDPRATSHARFSNAGTSTNPAASSGEAVREASFANPNEASGQTADSIGPNHQTLSFATAATSGRAEAASPVPGAAAAMPTATGQFHQDNFHQLVERAMFTVRGAQSEARIALKPDHLGHVQMKVVTEHHMVHIKIMAESPAARDLIDAHAHQLKSELQQQGLTVEHIEVSVSTNGHGDANRGERQREAFLHQLARQGQSPEDDDIDPSPRRAGQLMSGRSRSNGIDYFA